MDCLENERAFATWDSFCAPWHQQASVAYVESEVGLKWQIRRPLFYWKLGVKVGHWSLARPSATPSDK